MCNYGVTQFRGKYVKKNAARHKFRTTLLPTNQFAVLPVYIFYQVFR